MILLKNLPSPLFPGPVSYTHLAAAAASSAEVQGPSAQEESTDTSAASDSSEASGSKDSSASTQEEGTLSPSSGSTFTDNSDSSMDNLLNQVQSLLPTDNGTWSVYVCNLAKNTEGTINDQQMQAASLIKLYIMGAAVSYTHLDVYKRQDAYPISVTMFAVMVRTP